MLSHSIVSDSLQPNELQPTRLHCPQNFSRQKILAQVAISDSRVYIIININKSIFPFLVPSTKFLFLTNNLVYSILFLFIISMCKCKIMKIYLMFLYSFRSIFLPEQLCSALCGHSFVSLCFSGSSGLSPNSREQKQWCILAYATLCEFSNLLTAFPREYLLDQN